MVEIKAGIKAENYIPSYMIITKLLGNKEISNPKKLSIMDCSISDLKYNGKDIFGASIDLNNGSIFLDIEGGK